MPEAAPTTPTTTNETTTQTPPAAPTVEFDGPFDEERAKRKIAAVEADKAKLKERLAAFEAESQRRADAEKSELQKAIERAERAEKLAAEHAKAEMKRVALKAAGLADDLAEFIHGDTAEELAARAKTLAEKLGAAKPAAEPITAKPKARLTAGHESAGAPADDAKSIAAHILANR